MLELEGRKRFISYAYPLFEGIVSSNLQNVNSGMRIHRLSERLEKEVGIKVPTDFFKYIIMNDKALFDAMVKGKHYVEIIFKNLDKEELVGIFVIGLHSFITKYNGSYLCNERCEITLNKSNAGFKLTRGEITVHITEEGAIILKQLLDMLSEDKRVNQLRNTFFTKRGY